MSSSGSAAAAAASSWDAQLQAALAERQWTPLLRLAQQRELEEGGVWSRDSEVWFAIQLFAAALADECLSGKFTWKRIPADMKKKSKDLSGTWKLLSALLTRDFSGFFAHSIALQASFSPLVQRLNTALRGEVQARNLVAIRVAYALVSVDQAAPLLGLSKSEVPAFLLKEGWTPDAQAPTQFFTPTPADSKKGRDISQKQIEQLTKYVTHLED